ncbi:putative two-component system sensor kinase [Nocardia nova SH22a]|uniref:Putative two-component system sensor kinase n=1 Tax=Nocardia nova SH22a TaxID=1415166 RepID=W5TWC5_9NOCA|nr:histidine kinase [Nocardia nova]AHH21471.1 putative two-component system sensor kinase [Nocardia nova SH22a]
MSGVRDWWHALSGAAKFRLYSRVTLEAAVVILAVAMTIGTRSWWSAAANVVAGLAAVAAMEEQPEFALSPNAVSRRWVRPAAVTILAGVWVAYAVLAGTVTNESVLDHVRPAGVCVAVLAMFSIVPFIRYRWWAVVVLSLATGLVFGSSPLAKFATAGVTLAFGVFVVGTTLLTVWGLRVVEDLDRAKVVEAELKVAEERLRFARDLHDVVGRGFSAIAVKSELAVALSKSGDGDRAVREMDEVKTLAVESMGQMRELVRGYRSIDLKSEVAGARSVLSAVGCELTVEGDPESVPAHYYEAAAWVVREGTTNIVEHSSASSAVLALGDAGMSLRNDRPDGTFGERSGLRGLAERLAPLGATLDTGESTDEFILEIRWRQT